MYVVLTACKERKDSCGGAGVLFHATSELVTQAFCCFCLGRYGNVPFTKNPEKYIKYRVEQVGEMIERLFDTSA